MSRLRSSSEPVDAFDDGPGSVTLFVCDIGVGGGNADDDGAVAVAAAARAQSTLIDRTHSQKRPTLTDDPEPKEN